MKPQNLINSEIEAFYCKVSDEDRYTKGLGPLELERNKTLIGRYIKSPKRVVIDVGGGTGIYSQWLADLGHQVHLVDPVAKHIRKAKSRMSEHKQKFTCYLGESKRLCFADNLADLVLVHGPLYHLQSGSERIKAIKEAKRVCKKNGVILAVAINYASYTLVGLLNGMIHQQGFYQMCRSHLLTGLHNPPQDNQALFLPQAFFHKPDELINEFKQVDLREIDLIAVEGMSWLDKDFFQNWENPVKKKALMSLLELTEKDPYLISLSPHMMIVGRK
ncbi:class I SAM-dependent methyltransferase [Rhodocytophaga aerolata]|uniref:Class I SAM-dependent methyltransferase n=1 Tax=Rhodocytophaga aerolata TaxID=455078 RepID=A0ABT8RFF6_9BACT|nr:class I SAM-dependent methyltransferase [Rhodocytophaga aerolata]MDO1450839.1 class I SAM-dependent methyltransferase [Rhodocytophaga aerolata]